MLIALSPAKSLDFSAPPVAVEPTAPELLDRTRELAAVTKKLSRADLRRLMDVSDKLADLNFERFQSFDPEADGGLPAVLAFDGDVYTGLDARTLDEAGLRWAQDRLRILSGLYGVLRPLDRLQPYRLEMGTRLRTKRGATLYDFWGGRIAEALNAAAADHGDPTLVNLASAEYFGAVDAKALKIPVVQVRFMDEKDGRLRTLGLYAKTARGAMARWAIDRRVERAEDLKACDAMGYRFDPKGSTETDWLFTRPQPPLKKG